MLVNMAKLVFGNGSSSLTLFSGVCSRVTKAPLLLRYNVFPIYDRES